MKVLLLGDRFITNEIWKEALEKRFAGSGVIFSYAQHQLQWPVVPMESNEEDVYKRQVRPRRGNPLLRHL